MTYAELLAEGKAVLRAADAESFDTDAFLLFEAAAGLDRAGYLFKMELDAPGEVQEKYRSFIEKRAAHVPCQYILGEAFFYGLRFRVDENVLIPRLDTEVLVQEALEFIQEKPCGSRVLDVCTGSGCIGITIKKECPEAELVLSDISKNALSLAKENAENNGVSAKFILSDLFGNITGGFDLIVSNPPYVSESEYRDLAPEVKDSEPALALLAGEEGLDIYKRLIPGALPHLSCGGALMLEIGAAQAAAVCALMRRSGYSDIYTKKDLAGLDRVVCGRKQKNV